VKQWFPSHLRAVLVDIDGTLVQSNDAHAHAWHEALLEAGYHVPVHHIRPLIGMGSDKLIQKLHLTFEENKEAGKHVSERRQDIFLEKYLHRLHPTPGARDLLSYFRALGLPLVAATAAQKKELCGLLETARIRDLLNDASDADEVRESKPASDTVSAALNKAGVRAEEAILLGDTCYDVEAGTRAGVPVIAFRCGGSSDADLRGAHAVYDSPGDLLADENFRRFVELSLGTSLPYEVTS
jgi:beta-phosphoglucomutase-like phosphatase (HAD superfamily)